MPRVVPAPPLSCGSAPRVFVLARGPVVVAPAPVPARVVGCWPSGLCVPVRLFPPGRVSPCAVLRGFVRSPVPVRAVRFRPGLHGLAGGFHRGAQRLPWQVGDVSFCVTTPNLHSPPAPPFQRFHGLSDGPAARVCAANPKVRPPRSGRSTLPPLIRLWSHAAGTARARHAMRRIPV